MSNVERHRALATARYLSSCCLAGCRCSSFFCRRFHVDFWGTRRNDRERKQQPLTIARSLTYARPDPDPVWREILPRRVLKTRAIEALFDGTLVYRGIFVRFVTISIQSVSTAFHFRPLDYRLTCNYQTVQLISHERHASDAYRPVFEWKSDCRDDVGDKHELLNSFDSSSNASQFSRRFSNPIINEKAILGGRGRNRRQKTG